MVWHQVPNGIRRYTDALLRHLFAEGRGELHDADSHLTHAVAIAWNVLAGLELLLTTQGAATETQPGRMHSS